MSAVKCQARNPLQCEDKYCPNRLGHYIDNQDRFIQLEAQIRKEAEESFNWDEYYSSLYSSLTGNSLLGSSMGEAKQRLNVLKEEEDSLNDSIMEPYYENGEWGDVPPEVLSRLGEINEEQARLGDVLTSMNVAYHATFAGNSELKKHIRELKNAHPKDRKAVQDSLKLLHESDNLHKKQIIAALMHDANMAAVDVEISFNRLKPAFSTFEDEVLLKNWKTSSSFSPNGLEVEHSGVRKILGFRNHVDMNGLTTEGKFFAVERVDGEQVMTAEVPEKFLTIFPKVRNLTMFKPNLISTMIVLRRLRKRGLATPADLDMLKEVEYNSKRIAEMKQL